MEFPFSFVDFNFICKIINQNVVINGSDIIDTSDKVWIVQNGKYLTYPKIDREQTWNFSSNLSISVKLFQNLYTGLAAEFV